MKVLISDEVSWHAQNVLTALSTGYGSNLANDTIIRLGSGLANDLEYAKLNNISLVVRSYDGVGPYPALAAGYYSDIQLVMPMGANAFMLLSWPSDVSVIVATGAGVTENATAYGPGLEFWSIDPLGETASSYSNGYIAGQLLKIKEGRGFSWWNARYAARQTASGGGTRTNANGYGQIDVTAAIAYSGAIIDDPYIGQTTGMIPGAASEEETNVGLTTTTKTAVDALTLDPANTEANFQNHATMHDAVHTALQEIYGIKRFEGHYVQTDENAPVLSADVENTTGNTLTPTRINVGIYRFTFSASTLNGASKTRIIVQSANGGLPRMIDVIVNGLTIFTVYCFDHTGTLVDGNKFWVSVNIYPD